MAIVPFVPRPGRAPATTLAGLALLLAGCAGGPADPPRPSVLLVTVDTLRADGLGAPMPALDALAAAGTRFTAAQAPSSWTLPSLGALLTSTVTSTNGLWGRDASLGDSFTTLAEHLAAAGYATGAVASHVFLHPRHGLSQGFEHYDTALVKGLMASHEAISSPEVTARSLAWLDERAAAGDERPFLLWAHYFDPHDVYHEHPGFPGEGQGGRARYRSEVAFTDHWIGRLVDGLAERGLDQDTLVVVVADHGEEFGEHGAARHGHTLYDELTRVPLVLRLPAAVEAAHGIGARGREVATPVGVVDILPTLLELCDVAPRLEDRPHVAGEIDVPPFAGQSLVPLLAGDAFEPRPLLSELRLRPGRHAEAVVVDGYKLKRWADGRQELYDLGADPTEQDDLLAPDAPPFDGAELSRLERLLEQSLEVAELTGRFHEQGAELELTPAEAAAMDALGYTGDD